MARGLVAPVWCVVQELVELGGWDLNLSSERCCWSLAWPRPCPPAPEMTGGGGGGGVPTLPQTAKPMQGADGAHLECAVSAKAKPISELITGVLCESWGFPGDGGDEATPCLPSAALGAAGGAG